jgi:hypothetical protein
MDAIYQEMENVMTLSEFKAWMEGFSVAIGDAPSAEQWKAILAKLDGVESYKFMAAAIPPSGLLDKNKTRLAGQHNLDRGN